MTTPYNKANDEAIIKVKNLRKSFGDNEVLKGIDYEIHRGEKIVVIGPSGSGKSTFLRCLNLLEQPTEMHYRQKVRHQRGSPPYGNGFSAFQPFQ